MFTLIRYVDRTVGKVEWSNSTKKPHKVAKVSLCSKYEPRSKIYILNYLLHVADNFPAQGINRM